MDLITPGTTLHGVFGNPDENPEDPIRFPEFIPCNSVDKFEVLQRWIDEALTESAVEYRRRTSYNGSSALTIVLACAHNGCGHTVTAKINNLQPFGWELLSGTFHCGHTPGEAEDLLKLRLAKSVRREIELLIESGLTDREIIAKMNERLVAEFSGTKRRIMAAHGGVCVTRRRVQYARSQMLRELHQ